MSAETTREEEEDDVAAIDQSEEARNRLGKLREDFREALSTEIQQTVSGYIVGKVVSELNSFRSRVAQEVTDALSEHTMKVSSDLSLISQRSAGLESRIEKLEATATASHGSSTPRPAVEVRPNLASLDFHKDLPAFKSRMEGAVEESLHVARSSASLAKQGIDEVQEQRFVLARLRTDMDALASWMETKFSNEKRQAPSEALTANDDLMASRRTHMDARKEHPVNIHASPDAQTSSGPPSSCRDTCLSEQTDRRSSVADAFKEFLLPSGHASEASTASIYRDVDTNKSFKVPAPSPTSQPREFRALAMPEKVWAPPDQKNESWRSAAAKGTAKAVGTAPETAGLQQPQLSYNTPRTPHKQQPALPSPRIVQNETCPKNLDGSLEPSLPVSGSNGHQVRRSPPTQQHSYARAVNVPVQCSVPGGSASVQVAAASMQSPVTNRHSLGKAAAAMPVRTVHTPRTSTVPPRPGGVISTTPAHIITSYVPQPVHSSPPASALKTGPRWTMANAAPQADADNGVYTL